METHDIDLTGGDLPPGVTPGSLDGTNEAPTPAEPSPEEIAEARTALELDADFDAALRGEGGGEHEDEHEDLGVAEPPVRVAESDSGAVTPGFPAGQEADSPPAPEPAPTPARKPARKRKPKAKPAAKAAPRQSESNVSGTVSRTYFIFQETQAEVNGQIMAVYVKCSFALDDETVEGLHSRNRNTALKKAGKLFGVGFDGTLVATPASYFQPKRVRNMPRQDIYEVHLDDEGQQDAP